MRLAALLGCLVAAVVLAGCGGSTRDSVSLDSVAHAATRTAEAGSSRFELRMTMDTGGQSVAMSASGAFDYDGQRGRMTMQMPELGGSFEVLFDGTVLFMRMPEAQATQLPGGKRWLKVDLQRLGGLAGADVGALMQMQRQQNPAQLLDYLKSVEGSAQQLGREEVRGVATTHYRATMDLRKALDLQLEALPEEQRAALRAQLEHALATVAQQGGIPIDVWVDDDGVARRMAMKLAMAAGAGAAATMEMSMDLFDFGVDVDVDHPRAGEVLDFAALVGGGSS